jgi:FkbM family methyltransferase
MSRKVTVGEAALSWVLRHLPIKHGAHRILDRVCPSPWVGGDSLVAFEFHGKTLTLDVSDLVGWHFFMLRSFDPEVVETLVKFADTLGDGEVFWDIGANKGACSYQIAYALPRCRIVAVEPQDDLSVWININLIGLGANAINLSVGLGDEEVELDLHIPAGNKGGASLLARSGIKRRVMVKTASWIKCKSGFGWPTLVKIDVEGFEPRVIRSLLPAFEGHAIKCCVFECHASETEGLFQIRAMTAPLGYKIFAIRKSAFSTWLEEATELVTGATDYALLRPDQPWGR